MANLIFSWVGWPGVYGICRVQYCFFVEKAKKWKVANTLLIACRQNQGCGSKARYVVVRTTYLPTWYLVCTYTVVGPI